MKRNVIRQFMKKNKLTSNFGAASYDEKAVVIAVKLGENCSVHCVISPFF